MALQRKHTMYHSTIIDAAPDEVWAVVRDALKVVSIVSGPGVKDVCWAEGGAVEKVPARYDFTMVFNDGLVQQEIAGRDEVNRAQTYRAIAPATGVDGYVATIRIREITNEPGRCFFDWSRELTIAPDADDEVVETIVSMMSKQADLMRDYFAQR
ncbi:SRPBCC family protein [Streptomyces boninensis]|uniref:SRPBCC family protein n=1 Tax=Streptomyces boninensis TaxID=2039455 RepID=UPI003B2195C2